MIRILLLFLILNLPIVAGEPIAAFQIDNVWSFVDEYGQVIFKSKGIVEIGGMKEGLIGAKIVRAGNEEWVYFDKEGKIVLEPGTDDGLLFSHGYAVVFNEINPDKGEFEFGMIDKSGEFVLPIEYKDALGFTDGLAYIMNDSTRGYIDTNLNMVIELQNDIIGYSFSEGLAPVSNKDYKVGYIDKSGELQIAMKFDLPAKFSEGLATAPDTRSGKFGYINKFGVYTISPVFDEALEFNNDYTFVASYDANYIPSWGLMDKRGKMITDLRFQDAEEFSQDVALVKLDNKFGFIDTTGNFIFQKNFDKALSYNDLGLALVINRDAEIYGFINKNGEVVLELPLADEYFDLNNNLSLSNSE